MLVMLVRAIYGVLLREIREQADNRTTNRRKDIVCVRARARVCVCVPRRFVTLRVVMIMVALTYDVMWP